MNNFDEFFCTTNNIDVFIDIIKEYLTFENITINQFSKRIDVPGESISTWITKEFVPDITSVIKVADFFKCSVDYLFGLAEFPTITTKYCDISFYERFKSLISAKNITCYRCAKEIEIGESALTKWKKGVYPKTETLLVLAKYLDCSVDFLIGRG